MNEFLVGLVVLAVSGLAFTAYNHRELYKQHSGRLMRWLYAATGIAVLWNYSAWWVSLDLLKLIPADKIPKAKAAIESCSIPDEYIMIFTGLAFFAWAAGMASDVIHKDVGKAES